MQSAPPGVLPMVRLPPGAIGRRRRWALLSLAGVLTLVVVAWWRSSGVSFVAGALRGARSRCDSPVSRFAEVPPREPGYVQFRSDRLRAETEDPFTKIRIALFGAGAVSALLALVFSLSRLAASTAGAPKAKPVMEVAQDVLLNGGASVLCGFLAFNDFRTDRAREEMKQEGVLIARGRVWLQDAAGPGKDALVRLSELRASRGKSARRPVLCIGDLRFCLACVESSSKIAEDVHRADLLLVPVLNSGEDRAPLVEAASRLRHVALPPAKSSNWDELCNMQAEKVRNQGLDGSSGQVVIIKKNGRVATRFLGVPNWNAIAGEISGRVAVGLDTQNI